MKPAVQFAAASLSGGMVDPLNSVVRGVSVITAGVVARGHDLAVDETTLAQMQQCAEAKGQVPVKVDHKSGAASVCGFLTNFRREGSQLKADWHLLTTHPQTPQILETAERMPGGVGLSASFLSPESGERGKARCTELLSVDYVTMPAANPNGLFAAKADERARLLSGVEKVRRVLDAAGHGAKVGAVSGVAARLLLRRRGIRSDATATAGAAVGALAAGAYQWRRDSRRDLAARVASIMFQDRIALRKLADAVRDNVSTPGNGEAETVRTVARKPIVRRAATRALKIGAGAGLGYVVGRRYGGKAGAVSGAVAGLLFQSPEVGKTVRLAFKHAQAVTIS